MQFDYVPSSRGISALALNLAGGCRYRFKITRFYRDGKRKNSSISPEKLAVEFPLLQQIDFDFYYRPGNSEIRMWAYIELKIDEKTARTQCHGDFKSFNHEFNICIKLLDLKISHQQRIEDLHEKIKGVLSPRLFSHIGPLIKEGNYSAALSAAVVFVEDALRVRIGAAGNGLTGSDLALYGYKNPGILVPPLAHVTNAQDNAFILIKGWFGLVRNLHGHQALSSISLDEGFDQLLGANYVLWIIENSKRSAQPGSRANDRYDPGK